MSLSLSTFGVSLLAIGHEMLSITSGQTCSSACGNTSTSCIDLVSDNLVVGCYGSWYGGTTSSAALNLCNAYGGGWHECESANEAEILGLTTTICDNTVPVGHSFWSLESSLVEQNDGECFSKNGYASCCDRPRNDIWGCVNSQTSIPGCGTYENTPCGVLNINCGDYANADFGDSGLQLCNGACSDTELFIMHATDNTKNGVLCCRDTIPNENPKSQCDESIYVYSLRQGYASPLPNFAPYIGRYEYYGNNENGYPRYVHTDSGAEITVSNFMTADLVLKLIIPDYGIFWSPAISFESGFVIDAGNNRFEIADDYFSPWGTDTSASTNNDDHLEWIANGAQSLQMTATFNDCINYGLELVSATNDNGCENYDHTVYDTCLSDEHCADCQNWGCATCESGYYKMGNKKRCQSCTDNYGSDCTNCNDWNGCVACGNGKTLSWNPTCNDQTCQ